MGRSAPFSRHNRGRHISISTWLIPRPLGWSLLGLSVFANLQGNGWKYNARKEHQAKNNQRKCAVTQCAVTSWVDRHCLVNTLQDLGRHLSLSTWPILRHLTRWLSVFANLQVKSFGTGGNITLEKNITKKKKCNLQIKQFSGTKCSGGDLL